MSGGRGDDGEGGFLGRWSRRKAEQRRGAIREERPADAPEPANAALPVPVDPASLPDIESLTPESDFSPFLRAGVPDALRKAALRKLYVTEPSVVNYEPLVEYGWNFTAPGYGDLLPSDDVAKYMAQIVRSTVPERAPEMTPGETGTAGAALPPPADPAPVRLDSPPARVAADAVAAHSPRAMPDRAPDAIAGTRPADPPADHAEESPPAPVRRRHGGALPG